MAKSDLEHLDWRLWRMIYLTETKFKICLDQLCAKHGLTSEQYTVLLAAKYLDAPVRISDIAKWLERSTNSVSMLVDRMVKAGLVKRARDRVDRRVVTVSITAKAEQAFGPTEAAVRKLVKQVTSSLSEEDKHAFLGLIKVIDRSLVGYLNPGADIETMIKEDLNRHEKLLKRWLK